MLVHLVCVCTYVWVFSICYIQVVLATIFNFLTETFAHTLDVRFNLYPLLYM